ncbi:DNA helicase UvrD [Candidatus Dojkabacteria bacterium]|nr:DNA helicase UvrD [Candidatus Dojkabacteria bacterium]
MRLIADFHIHSHFSRATSKEMNIEALYRWGKIKGINVIGTGDFTHPAWISELKEKLEPSAQGLYSLKKKYAKSIDDSLPESISNKEVRFILTAEISTIYSKLGKVRKVHSIIIVPSFDVADKLNEYLATIGNIKSDGRPILGLDAKELLKITLDSHSNSMLIPAHIWTPWFSMFGSKSGFDSIEECYDELSCHIKAIETGLSSDPFMNWRLNSLRNLTIVSNSDAHSPAKLGREATILDCATSYDEIIAALRSNDDRVVGTIEFYPQEGKYFLDGHRKCNVRMMPSETIKNKGVCPKCGKPVVVGVNYRVNELADESDSFIPKSHKSVQYIIPLAEILAEIEGVKSVSSKRVKKKYDEVCANLGDEFSILRDIDIKDLCQYDNVLGNAINRMRSGDVFMEPGYDGVFGVIKVFKDASEYDQLPLV